MIEIKSWIYFGLCVILFFEWVVQQGFIRNDFSHLSAEDFRLLV